MVSTLHGVSRLMSDPDYTSGRSCSVCVCVGNQMCDRLSKELKNIQHGIAMLLLTCGIRRGCLFTRLKLYHTLFSSFFFSFFLSFLNNIKFWIVYFLVVGNSLVLLSIKTQQDHKEICTACIEHNL